MCGSRFDRGFSRPNDNADETVGFDARTGGSDQADRGRRCRLQESHHSHV
jgi:hypothetical protein